MIDYSKPAKFVLDGVRFRYRGESFKGSGFLDWNPTTGFHIDALLDKDFAPLDSLKTVGQIIVNTKEDTFTIWLNVRGHGRAFVPRAFPLGQKHSTDWTGKCYGRSVAFIRKHLFSQFDDSIAQRELENMSPVGMDWPKRVNDTLELLIPKLPTVAANLKIEVPKRLNEALRVLNLVNQGKIDFKTVLLGDPTIAAWFANLEEAATNAATLVENIDSQHISAEVHRQILFPAHFGNLGLKNSGSIYPDFYMVGRDYSMLAPGSTAKASERFEAGFGAGKSGTSN